MYTNDLRQVTSAASHNGLHGALADFDARASCVTQL